MSNSGRALPPWGYDNGFISNPTVRTLLFGNPMPYRPGVEASLRRAFLTQRNRLQILGSQDTPQESEAPQESYLLPQARTVRQSEPPQLPRFFRPPPLLRENALMGVTNVPRQLIWARQSIPIQLTAPEAAPVEPVLVSREVAEGEDVRRITNDDVTLYGQIREYIRTGVDSDGKRVILDLSCQICTAKPLEVPDVTTPVLIENISDSYDFIQVNPCGHFFGVYCMLKWAATSEFYDKLPTCPTCRFELCYPECRHIIPTHIVITDRHDSTATLPPLPPLTIPEGGSVPDKCAACRGVPKGWFEW